MRPGQSVVLFDGTGGEHPGRIAAVDRSVVRVQLDRYHPAECESPLAVGLVQVVSAGERMDLTIQKAVELGVAWIQPLITQWGKVRLDGERAERRVAHWQRVVVAACEQCGRNRVPPVHPVREFTSWLPLMPPAQARLLLDPAAAKRLSEAGPLSREVVLLSGGEAGFAPAEVASAERYGFLPVRLGPRVLRTETAGIAALAALQALWGDF